ncbi:anti-sigma factor domain-containing protein [Chloroflexota bacterium]
MLKHLDVIELMPAYALGSLDEEEAIQVAEHLDTCSGCRAELLSYQGVADRLALAAPGAVPPPKLKQQILGQLQMPRLEPAIEPRQSWWQGIAGVFQRATPVWGIASLALIALLVLSNLWWWQRGDREGSKVTPAGMHVVSMAGTDAAPAAVGTLVISGDGEYGTLVVDGLPALDADHQYQLWLIRDGLRTSGGVFSVNPEGYGALWISSPEPLSSYPGFGITIEPEGGSPGPTGDKVLGSSL